MNPQKLFLVVLAALLAAAGVIYGVRQASLAHERAQYVKSIHQSAMDNAAWRLRQVEELRCDIRYSADKQEVLKLLFQFRNEVHSELVYWYDRDKERHAFWKERLAEVEVLTEKILKTPLYSSSR